MDSYTKLSDILQTLSEEDKITFKSTLAPYDLSESHLQLLDLAFNNISLEEAIPLSGFKNKGSLLKYTPILCDILEDFLIRGEFISEKFTSYFHAYATGYKKLAALHYHWKTGNHHIYDNELSTILEIARKFEIFSLKIESLERIRKRKTFLIANFKTDKIDEEILVTRNIIDGMLTINHLTHELQSNYARIRTKNMEDILDRINQTIGSYSKYIGNSEKLKLGLLKLERAVGIINRNGRQSIEATQKLIDLTESNPILFGSEALGGYHFLIGNSYLGFAMWGEAEDHLNQSLTVFKPNSLNSLLANMDLLSTYYFSNQTQEVDKQMNFLLEGDWKEKNKDYYAILRFIQAVVLHHKGEYQESIDILNTLDFITKDKDHYNSQVTLLLLINYYEQKKQDLVEKQFVNLRRYVDRTMKGESRKELFKHMQALVRPLLDSNCTKQQAIAQKQEHFDAVAKYYKETWLPSVPDYFHLHVWLQSEKKLKDRFYVEEKKGQLE